MNNNFINKCLCCDSGHLSSVLDLNNQPPANLYSYEPRVNYQEYPLKLNRCVNCWHCQLSYNVNRSDIFDDYAYVSGTSGTLNKYFQWFANALAKTIGENKRILEIAANDGSLISAMQNCKLNCVGVDPAKNIVDKAIAMGLPIQLGYWPSISSSVSGRFDAIIAMNVLAHVDNPLDFLKACSNKLESNGLVIIQPSQARMIENGEFDTIYHEHISFFNTNSMSQLASRAGLKLVGTALVKVHGDSPIYFLQREDLSDDPPDFKAFRSGVFSISEDLQSYELKAKLYSNETYLKFEKNSLSVINNVKEVVENHVNMGFKVAFVGAAAKAITVLNAAKIIPDFLLDESPLKIGLYAPGCNTLVQPLSVVKTFSSPVLFIISAWNFRDELVSKLKTEGVPDNSKFYVYFPHPAWL